MLGMWRTWAWVIVVTSILILGAGRASAIAEDECRVELSQGWSGGTGTGKIVMKNNQKPCGSALYTVPVDKRPVDTGSDRFTLRAEGPDRDGRRLKLMGEVTVQVNP